MFVVRSRTAGGGRTSRERCSVKLKSLGYVGLESVECDVWEDLGPRIFGFGPAERAPGGSIYLRLDDRHHRIAVHPGEQDRMAYIGWDVANGEDLEEAAAELAKSGVQVEAGTAEECELRHGRHAPRDLLGGRRAVRVVCARAASRRVRDG